MKSIIYSIILVLITAHSGQAQITNGYTDKLSYRPTETVTFFISGYTCDFELDNFDGTFAVSMGTFSLSPQSPVADAWLHGFGYSQSFTWQVPSTLSSGYYLVNNKIPIIIKETHYPEEGDIVVVIPTNTLSAYNHAGGASLYTDGITVVSFLRPFDKTQEQFTFLQGFINWLRTSDISANYSVSYIADNDMDDYDEISGAKVLIIPGHSEYWTRQARLNFDKFVDGDGVNPGKDATILSGNTMWWQVRYEDDNGNPQLVCHRGEHWGTSYDNDPVADILDPEYHPLHATYHWGEPSLKYSILGSIGSDWLRGGYGVDCGTSAANCYGGYNGFRVTTPGSPLLRDPNNNNDPLFAMHDYIHFATGEYDGTLVKIDNDGNLITDANGDPQLDVSALGFYRAEMVGYDEVQDYTYNQAGGFPDLGNTNTINVCPLMVFQKTCTSGTIINVNSNQWCSDWVIGHGLTGQYNQSGNTACGTSATCVPDPNIPQITDNMINLMMDDQTQNLSGNNLFSNSPPSYPSFIIKPTYTNVSYNICSGGLIDITPCGVYLTGGYKVDHGFRWNQSSIESASTNLHNVHYSYITSACTDFNNGDLARPQNNGNSNNTATNLGLPDQISESNDLSSVSFGKSQQKTKSFSSNQAAEINIFPNLSQGIFILQSPVLQFSNASFIITNALGEKIIKQKIISNRTEINLSNQPDGIYFVKVIEGDRMVVKKVVKM